MYAYDAPFQEQNFRLQYRLIVLEVLRNLHERFPFPLSGLSYKQADSQPASQSGETDIHNADLVGAY
jgi:hypothetical protein